MTVLLVCRDVHKGEAARQEILAIAGHPRVDLLISDLSDQESIVQLAQEVRWKYPRLDVLIHNAGLILPQRTTTAQGLETILAVNHLAPFLLTHLLLDWLRKSKEARIITVSSEAHRLARLDWDDWQAEKKYRSWIAYANAKLGNILFTRELAARLKGENITVNCLHPGVVGTGFASSFEGGAARLMMQLARPFFLSAEQGAQTSIFLASSSEVVVSGEYFVKKSPKSPSSQALSQYNAQRLWEISSELTRLPEWLNVMQQA
jgi:NAD(P)-dependent dehydrogenase (short-subunit alcohol dehydrogenase family)